MKMFREPRVEGIRYARFLLRMAEDYKAKKAAGSTWETQKLLRQIRGDKRKKTIWICITYTLSINKII